MEACMGYGIAHHSQTTQNLHFCQKPSNRLAAKLIADLRKKSGITALHGRGILNQGLEHLDNQGWLVFVQDQRLNDGIVAIFLINQPKHLLDLCLLF